MSWLPTSALALALLAGGAGLLRAQRTTTHSAEGLATFALPREWKASHVVREPSHALFRFRRSQSWWFGAGDPLEVDAWVVILAPDADEATMQRALADAFRRVSAHVQDFPAVGSITEAEREAWVSAGTYRIHELHDPQKVVIVRSLDRARRVALVARTYERKLPRERLLRIARDFHGSLQLTERRGRYFGEVAGWPAVRAERVRRERAYLDAVLARRGLPPARLDTTVARDGWVYTLYDDELVIGRLLGSRRLERYAYGARGELAWLWHRGREWDAGQPSKGARPPRGERYFPSRSPLARWATEMGPELDRSLAWFFTVHGCRLTGEEWEEPRDLAACELDAWLDNALRLEQAFRADRLKIE